MRLYKDYRVGETFQTASRTITPEEVDYFVTYIGVQNPLFTDPEHASNGPFHTRIIPGFLTQSLALGLLYHPKIIQYFLLTEAHTRFRKPVKIGDSIQVKGKILQKKTTPKSKAGLLTLVTEIQNQNTETVAEMKLKVSILKQPPPLTSKLRNS